MALHRTSSMATRRLLVVTVAAGWLLATSLAAEPEGPADDFFASWMAMKADAANAHAHVSTAAVSYATRHAGVKTVCLKELRQHDCRYVGCPSVLGACSADNRNDLVPDNEPPTCYDCINHIASVTDLACCNDEAASEYGGAGTSDFLAAGSYKIGSCEFDADLFRRLGDISGYDYSPVRQGGANSYKAGSAWGTCTILGGGAEQCGSPLCNKLVLRFQGGLYLTGANSKYGYTSDSNYDQTCNDLWGLVYGAQEIGRRLQSTDATTTTTTTTITAGDALERKLARGVLRRLVNSTTLRNLPISWDRVPICRLAAGTPANGIAIVLSGPFTVISLETDVEYSAGMLEYVPFFFPACEVNTGVPITPNANSPYVRPNTVKLHFVPSPDEAE